MNSIFAIVIILIGNVVLYYIVRVAEQNEYVQREYPPTQPVNAVGLAIICFVINMFFLLNALGSFPSWQSKIIPVIVACITGIPWMWPLFKILLEANEILFNVATGISIKTRETPNLKTVYTMVQNQQFEAALVELEITAQGYPEAFEPHFLMATVHHSLGNDTKELETLEFIMGNWRFIYDARINAAQRIREILEERDGESPELADIDAIIQEFTEAKNKMRGDPNKPGHGERVRDPNLVDLYKARRLNSRKGYKEAIPLFKGYIEKHPENFRAHFELVSTLEHAERMDDAIIWLDKIVHRFHDREFVWGDAMMRLAGIREHHLGDLEGAVKTLETVAERLQYEEVGEHARDRLKMLKNTDSA